MIIILYKKNHPITPKQVVNVIDLGYLGVENDFPEQLSSLPYKKKRNKRVICRRKRVQQNSFQKEDSDRAYHHCQIEKVQNTE